MDPFSQPHELIAQSVHKVLPEHRWRDIRTMAAVPETRKKIEDLWLEEMAKQTPAPVVIEVEKQTTPDYTDILQRCDLPSLVALVTAKVLEQTKGISAAIHALAPQTNGHVGAPLVPPVSLLAQASSKPRKPRVLIVGPLASQFRDIEAKTAEMNIPVELLWLDKDKNANGVPITTDYVIANEFIQHKLNNALKTSVPAGRYFFLQGTGITAMVNKLRDLGAMTPPRT